MIVDSYQALVVAAKALVLAQEKSDRAAESRARLPAGSSRARVTTANARWMRAAEERDRCLANARRAVDRAGLGVIADSRVVKPRLLLIEANDLSARATKRHVEALGWDVQVERSHYTSALTGHGRGDRYAAVVTCWGRDITDEGALVVVAEARARRLPVAILSSHERLVDGVTWLDRMDGSAIDRFLAEVEQGDEDTRHAGAQG